MDLLQKVEEIMGYTAKEAKAFIDIVAPIIQKYAKEYGYKVCSAVIAQALIEGGCGKSTLAYKYNNHFGLKCGSAKKGVWGVWDGTSVSLGTKEEYTPGTLTSIKANFRVFKADETHTALENGMRGYYEFISNSRYANLKKATDFNEYALYLKQDGYATSNSYVNTIVSTVKKYELQKYDDFLKETPSADVAPLRLNIAVPTVKKGSRGENVLLLQANLNEFGYGLVKDGIAGPKTESAIRGFQAKNNLVVDGIYGKNSYAKMKELLWK